MNIHVTNFDLLGIQGSEYDRDIDSLSEQKRMLQVNISQVIFINGFMLFI